MKGDQINERTPFENLFLHFYKYYHKGISIHKQYDLYDAMIRGTIHSHSLLNQSLVATIFVFSTILQFIHLSKTLDRLRETPRECATEEKLENRRHFNNCRDVSQIVYMNC